MVDYTGVGRMVAVGFEDAVRMADYMEAKVMVVDLMVDEMDEAPMVDQMEMDVSEVAEKGVVKVMEMDAMVMVTLVGMMVVILVD